MSDLLAQAFFTCSIIGKALFTRAENFLKYNEDVGGLHWVDAEGNRIKQHFAMLLVQKLELSSADGK